MNNIGLTLFTMSLCLYFSAAVVFIIDLRAADKDLFRTARNLLISGFAALTILLLGRVIVYRYFPMFTFHETLLLLTWTATFILLAMERNYHFNTIYHFAAPFLFTMLFFTFFFSPEQAILGADLKSAWLSAHIFTIIIAYGTFAIAFITAIMYLFVDHYLKKKRLSSFITKLPSLDTLDFYSHKLVSIGFFLLTISIFLGAMHAQNVWGSFWRWEPKEIWSGITWIIYAAYLHTRLGSGWQGRKVAMLNSIGFGTVLFNYIIVRFFFSTGAHQFF